MSWYNRLMRHPHSSVRLFLTVLTAMSFAAWQGCMKSESPKTAASEANTDRESPVTQPPAVANKANPQSKAVQGLNEQLEQAQLGTATVQKACEMYYAKHNVYPSGLGLLRREALLSPRGQIDPWGQRYRITVIKKTGGETTAKGCSSGPDKIAETADDICSEPMK